MSEVFNREMPETYKKMLGEQKFLQLWEEYLSDAGAKFEKAAAYLSGRDAENLRIIFHSLKSSSLIFGLDKFAELCTKIENNLVAGDFSEETGKKIKNSKNIWLESIKEAEPYFRP